MFFIPEGTEKGEDGIAISTMNVDQDFTHVMEIPFASGRNFDRDRPSDLEDSYLINEQAAARLGWSVDEAIGKQIIWPTAIDGSRPPARVGNVIGVVKDFTHQLTVINSLRRTIADHCTRLI